MVDARRTRGAGILGALGVFISLVGVTASLTIVFLSMRSVMRIGGACAEGGPFVPIRPCPEGVPALLIGGVWIGVIFAGLYVWLSVSRKAPSLAVLLWPALFLSLGWNFLQFGLHPPFGGGEASFGLLICAVVFFLMGGIPLFIAVPRLWKSFTRSGDAPHEPVFSTAAQPVPSIWTPPGGSTAAPTIWSTPGGSPVAAPTSWPTPAASQPAPTWSSAAAQDASGLLSELERLDSLHDQGALSDREYKRAKKRLLRSGGGG